MCSISIVDYEPQHQADFERLNRHWIEKYFEIEPLDEFLLSDPQEAIINPGGAILMATYNGLIAGTVALIKVDDSTFEFAKMAVDESFQRKGIAAAMSYASFEKAKALGARKMFLHTNSILGAALHLYEKLGFIRVPEERTDYKRADIKMELKLH